MLAFVFYLLTLKPKTQPQSFLTKMESAKLFLVCVFQGLEKVEPLSVDVTSETKRNEALRGAETEKLPVDQCFIRTCSRMRLSVWKPSSCYRSDGQEGKHRVQHRTTSSPERNKWETAALAQKYDGIGDARGGLALKAS